MSTNAYRDPAPEPRVTFAHRLAHAFGTAPEVIVRRDACRPGERLAVILACEECGTERREAIRELRWRRP